MPTIISAGAWYGPLIVAAFALIVGIPIGVAITKANNNFKKKCNSLKTGMTLQEIMSIMGTDELVESVMPKYKWEHKYYWGRGGKRTLYLTAIFENDILKIIDKNF